jgi:hypothetical protein
MRFIQDIAASREVLLRGFSFSCKENKKAGISDSAMYDKTSRSF